MQPILIWSAVIIPSLAWGLFCALKIRSRFALFIAGAVPWFGLLIALLYTEYFSSSVRTDASMWLIAQLFAGTIMAGLGMVSFVLARNLLNEKQ